jgi:hypothetical protein
MSSKSRGESASVLVELITARALWIIQQEAARTAISAATRALVEGKDTEPLCELAGASLDVNVHELGALIDASLVSLGLPVPALTHDEALTVAARHFVREAVQGRLPIRDLADWAHSAIGHDASPLTEDLVRLDDLYSGFDDGWGEKPNPLPILERFLDKSQDLDRKWTRSENP